MAHNLFGERFYGHREKAWHNLGLVTNEDMSALDVLTALGGGYDFEKRPVTVELNGEMSIIDDSYAIVRSATSDDPTERIFNYVTGRYNIVQPLRVCEIFDDVVSQPVETMGMLGKGEKLFLTWKLPKFDVFGDVVKAYAFVAIGYDGKYGVNLSAITTRVVCENTWNVAMNESERKDQEKGFGKIWNGKHHSPNIERDLEIWMEHLQGQAEEEVGFAKGIFEEMASTPITKDDAMNVLFGVYPNPTPLPENYPAKLIAEKQLVVEKKQKYANNDRELVMSLFESEGTEIDATAWGLFNSVTEYENWGRMTKKSADQSILFGNRANTMNRAKSKIMEYVEVR